MSGSISLMAVGLTFSGHILAPPLPTFSQIINQVGSDSPNCGGYPAQAIVGGKQHVIVGRRFEQDDSTGRISDGPSGQPMRPHNRLRVATVRITTHDSRAGPSSSVSAQRSSSQASSIGTIITLFANRHSNFWFGGFGGMHNGWPVV
jgi:hypothetical protein